MSRYICCGEEQVTNLFPNHCVIGLALRVSMSLNRSAEFPNFFFQLRENVFNFLPVEPNARGLC